MATVMQSKDQQAYELARKHYEVEEGLTCIVRFMQEEGFEAMASEPIKLLEVNRNTIASGIMPIQFAATPDHGISYPTTIIEVTPEEYQQIQARELSLPAGWIHQELIARPSL